jgi:hypothetical protein
MPAPTIPAWIQAVASGGISHPGLRISDAERAEVADLLSRHYGDGRLDEAEFNERLDQAMKAKTYADLSGLFADLPGTEPVETPAATGGAASAGPGPAKPAEASTGRPRRHRLRRVLFLALIVVFAAAAGHALLWSFSPLMWLAIIGVIILWSRRGPAERGGNGAR